MDQATAVYDASDSLVFTIYKEQRIDVPLESMGPYLVKALVAVEDRRFYDHHGFDVIRIVSAALQNVRHLGRVQGASTITQQLARTSFLTLDKTYSRKLQEVILAGRIERTFSKDRILELYLNKVYFGDGLYGVEAARAATLRSTPPISRWRRRRRSPGSSNRPRATRRPSAPRARPLAGTWS